MGIAPRNYESNHELPFREDPSKGIVGLKVSDKPRIFVVPVEALVSLSNTAKGGLVPWNEWGGHVKILSLPPKPLVSLHILHFQVVYVLKERVDEEMAPFVYVHDFSRRLVKAEGKKTEEHGPLRPVEDSPDRPRRIRLGGEIDPDEYWFDFTEGCVYAHPVS